MKKIILILFLLTLFAFQASALSISSQEQREITYTPGLEQDFNFKITNIDKNFSTRLEAGKLEQYISLEDLVPDSGDRTVKLKLRFPNIDIEPGRYVVYAVAKELPEGPQAMISALAEVKMGITLNALSSEKRVKIESKELEISAGELIKLELNVKSETYKTINALYTFGQIISSDGQVLKELKSKLYTLVSDERKSIYLEGDSIGLPEGEYTVKITVFYDGDQSQVDGSLKVGKLSVSLLDYTPDFLIGSINKLQLKVKNHFNKDLENVYAVINTANMEIKTPSKIIQKYGVETFDVYLDASSLLVGRQEAKIEIHYSDQVLTKTVFFDFKSKEKIVEKTSKLTYILLAGVVAMILIISLQLIFLRKKLKSNKTQSKENKRVNKKSGRKSK